MVTNKPPRFVGGECLKDAEVELDSDAEIYLPDIEDQEGLPFKVTASLTDGSPLPSFIKFKD
jgi:hypothetical protein